MSQRERARPKSRRVDDLPHSGGTEFDDQMRRARRVLTVTSLGLFFVMASASAVTLALPSMSHHFRVDATTANWFLIAFMLSSTASILVFGRISDLVDRKQIYLWGLVGYVVLSVACVFAPTAEVMILFRVLQGIAIATTLVNSGALIADALPASKLGQGLSVNMTASSLANIVGPTLGGLLVSLWGWQGIFLISVPIGIVAIVLGWKVLPSRPRQEKRQRERFDVSGALLSTVGLCLLLYGINQISVEGIGSLPVILCLAGGALLVAAFVVVEVRTKHPLVDLAIVRDVPRALAYLGSFFSSFVRAGVVVLVALHQQIVYGRDPAEAGIVLMVFALALTVFIPIAGRLMSVLTTRTMAAIGGFVMTVGAAGLVFTTGSESMPAVMTWLLVVGAGTAIFAPPNSTSILAGVPRDRRATANAVRSLMYNSAQTVGTTVALLCLTVAGVSSYATTNNDPSVQFGFQVGYGIVVLAALATLVLSVVRGGNWTMRRAAADDVDVATLS